MVYLSNSVSQFPSLLSFSTHPVHHPTMSFSDRGRRRDGSEGRGVERKYIP